MKKLFTPLLMLAALLSSTQAWAYSLRVAGNEVNTSATSVQTITGSGISGTITYNPSSRTLTMNNATIDVDSWAIRASGYTNGNDLNICFYGNNTIKTSSKQGIPAIYVDNNSRVYMYSGSTANGPASVTVKNTGSGPAIYVPGPTTGGRIDIVRLRLYAEASNNHCVRGSANDDIQGDYIFAPYLSYIELKAPAGKYALYNFTGWYAYENNMSQAYFENSSHSWNSSKRGIVDASGNLVNSTVIVPALTLGGVPFSSGRDWTVTPSSETASYMGLTAGTISYVSNTRTLTMNGVTINSGSRDLMDSFVSNLTVNLTGTNTLSSSTICMDLYGSTTLAGSGSLTATSNGTTVYMNSGRNCPFTINVNGTVRLSGRRAVHNAANSTDNPNNDLILKKAGDSSDYFFTSAEGDETISKVCHLTMEDMDFYTTGCYFDESSRQIKKTGGEVVKGSTVNIYRVSVWYDLWVAGKKLNSINARGLGSPYLTAGTVKYDNSTKTLTLDKVTMNVTADGVNAIKTNSGAGDITIKTIGDNRLTAKTDAVDIFSNTTFTSDNARLYLTSTNASGITTRGGINVTVDMTGYLGAVGAQYGYYGSGSDVLTLKKATSDSYGYHFESTNGAIRNLASLTLNNMDFWHSTSNGCYFDEADKRIEVNGGDIRKGVVEFGSIKEALPIYVCGKQLNRVNGADTQIYVGSKYISSGTQSVGYVPSTKTLTLNNAKIENSIQKGIALESGFDGYIKLVGTNSITTAANEGYYSCIATMKDNVKATFQGDGSLYAKGGANCALMPFRGTMIITDNVKIDAVGGVSNGGTSFGGIGSNGSGTNGETVIISGNAQVKANRISRIATLTLEDGQTIVEPFKAAFNSSTHQVEANGSLAQDVVIQKVEKYDLAVCNVDVNSYNKDDILRDGGTFKYAPNTKCLTITDADVHVDGYEYAAVTNRGVDGLNISVTGDNNFFVKGNTIFELRKGTTFSGKGTITGESLWGLLLNGSSSGSSIRCYLDGPSFNLKVRKYGIAGALSNLIVDSGCLLIEPLSSDATIFGLDGLTLGTGMIIAEPKGGVFDSNKRGIIVNGSLYNGRTIICQKGDVNVDGTVTIADAVAVLNAMAGQEVAGDPDVNGDKGISIADFVAVLNIMAGQ